MAAYRQADVRAVDIYPRRFGPEARGIGHMGYFRPSARPLRDEVLAWFAQHPEVDTPQRAQVGAPSSARESSQPSDPAGQGRLDEAVGRRDRQQPPPPRVHVRHQVLQGALYRHLPDGIPRREGCISRRPLALRRRPLAWRSIGAEDALQRPVVGRRKCTMPHTPSLSPGIVQITRQTPLRIRGLLATLVRTAVPPSRPRASRLAP